MKKGSSMITLPIFLIISIFMIIIIGVYIMNCIIPFIYHQKLITIASKYMFVIERFGFLTIQEKNLLYQDLQSAGFDTSKITLKYPNEIKSYGELIEFEINYILVIKNPALQNGMYQLTEKETILTIRKNSFSKI